ncbi:hypothetical protein [Paraburkholderia sp. BCC1886]|uniref:hypothetical protein n=1 Tax=Paraburkholderia sp. BCC1886 TaxID=2562670 RepID=UPI0011841BBF|nr:hypothetical protein [Paraburkholderia sp. BCC1886]
MSKQKQAPAVDVRRRNNGKSTPADELKDVLSQPVARTEIRVVLDEADPNPEATIEEVLADHSGPAEPNDAAPIGFVAQEIATVPSERLPAESIPTPEPSTDAVAEATSLSEEIEAVLQTADPKIAASLRSMMAFAERMAAIKSGAAVTAEDAAVMMDAVDDPGGFVFRHIVKELMARTPSILAWVSNQKYVPRNLILVVMHTPNGIPGITDQLVRSVLELHPMEITGAARGFSLEGDSKVEYRENRSSIEMRFNEMYGRAIGKAFETWGRRIKTAGINSSTTVDFMLIEPDATHRLVLDAWHCERMYPALMETDIAQRQFGGVVEAGPLCVTWGGKVTYLEDLSVAQKLLSEIDVRCRNPYLVDAADAFENPEASDAV